MHVPDFPPHEGWPHLGEARVPADAGHGGESAAHCKMAAVVAGGPAVFAGAVASVMIYYWYRLPSLIGFSMFPDGDEMLVDLRHSVPLWFLRPASSGIWMPRLSVGKHA